MQALPVNLPEGAAQHSSRTAAPGSSVSSSDGSSRVGPGGASTSSATTSTGTASTRAPSSSDLPSSSSPRPWVSLTQLTGKDALWRRAVDPLPQPQLLQLLQELNNYWSSATIQWPDSSDRTPVQAAALQNGTADSTAGAASAAAAPSCGAAANALHQGLTELWQQQMARSAGLRQQAATGGGSNSSAADAARSRRHYALELEMKMAVLSDATSALLPCANETTAFVRRYATSALLYVSQEVALEQAVAEAQLRLESVQQQRSSGLQRGMWSTACQRAAAMVLLQLQLLHQRSAAHRGIVEFTHISKSGGTSMCKLAQNAKCAAESFTQEGNCMVQAFGDNPTWSLEHDFKYNNGQVSKSVLPSTVAYSSACWPAVLCPGTHDT
jgi:hypothetical protein